MTKAARRPAAASSAEIADRLHRGVCQTLTGARLLASTVAVRHTGDAELLAALAKIETMLAQAAKELRETIEELR